MSWGLTAATVRFGGRTAVDGVTMTVEPGEIVAVVGGDGAGKTTLLRALVGLVPLAEGRRRCPPRRRLGYAGAARGTYANLTVRENLEFATRAYHVAPGRRLEEMVQAAGLTGAEDRAAAQLSGGMRQKLAVLMASVHRPDLLVLDEPSTGVDPLSRVELGLMLTRAAAAGAAVVFSTAYVDEAERSASACVLHEGRAIRQGPPEAIVAGTSGSIHRHSRRPPSSLTWMRGTEWHEWAPSAALSGNSDRIGADFEDAVIVATLQQWR